MGKIKKFKKAPSAETQVTCAVTKVLKANHNEHPTSSEMEVLSRTDRFFITSMLRGYPSRILLSEDTIIGGASLGSIMELGHYELHDDLKLKGPFESLHIVQLLNLQKIAWDCFNEVEKNKDDLHTRDFNLRYALKAIETFIQRLESRRAKQNSLPLGERVLVSLTPNTPVGGLTLQDRPNTLVDGVTLQELMESCRVELYLTLKPQNPFESILADLIVRTHKAGWSCSEQADWKRAQIGCPRNEPQVCFKGN